MSFIFYNPNPENRFVGDCVIRAVSKVIGQDWETTYADICVLGGKMRNMPSADEVWGEYLYRNGFDRHSIRNTWTDSTAVTASMIFLLPTWSSLITTVSPSMMRRSSTLPSAW